MSALNEHMDMQTNNKETLPRQATCVWCRWYPRTCANPTAACGKAHKVIPTAGECLP